MLLCLVYSLVHTHINAEYASLLVYRCEYIIEHDESCNTAMQVVARIQSSDDTMLQPSRHGVIKPAKHTC